MMAGGDARSFQNSVLREKIVEHLFIGELLKHFWNELGENVADLELMKSEFDAHGYDVIISLGTAIRHIQIKAGKAARNKRPKSVRVSMRLANKPGGCLLWIGVDDRLTFTSLCWYGEEIGSPMKIEPSFKVSRGYRRKDGEKVFRTGHREIPGARLKVLSSIPEVAKHLFG